MAATPEAGAKMSSIQQSFTDIEASVSGREQQPRRTIFKVGKREKEMKPPQYFQHDLISLGLYNRSGSGASTPTSDGDKFRVEIVRRLLEELGKTVKDWDEICKEIVQDPEEIRKLYDEEGGDLGMEDVRTILTLDALFLACCLGTYFHPRLGSMFRPIYEILQGKGASFCDRLFIDILKLENQIPLFLIKTALEFMILNHGGKQAVRTTAHAVVDVNGSDGEEVQRGGGIRQGNDVPKQLNSDRNQAEEESGNTSIAVNVPRVLELICKYFAFHHTSSLPFEWLGRRRTVGLLREEFRFEDSAHLLDSLYGGTREELLSHFGERADELDTGWIRRVNDELWDRCFSLMLLFMRLIVFVWMNLHPLIFSVKHRWSRFTKSMFGRSRHYWEIDWEIDSKKHIFSKIGGSLPSATKLHEAGVNCRGRSSPTGDKIVEFKGSLFQATLFLPTITNVRSESELLWRNLVAYENGRYGPGILMSYFHFMDMLINTEKDVVLLTMGKYPVIIRNSLGNEKAMANLYNSMLANYTYDFSMLPNYRDEFPKLDGFPESSYGSGWRWDMYRSYRVDEDAYTRYKIYRHYVTKWDDVTSAIHIFCNSKTRQKLVEFDRTYLSKPWLIISILAASTLLVLTVLQTTYSILSYIHRRDN